MNPKTTLAIVEDNSSYRKSLLDIIELSKNMTCLGSFQSAEPCLKALENGTMEKPGILLYHTPTNIQAHFSDRAGQQTGTYWRPDTRTTFAKSMGIDLQLSGHTHGGQFFPFTLITHLIYGGYDRGLHREEDFQIYITSGAGTWGPPMRVACPPEIPVITLH